ncbi:MAG: hypothetical protein ACJ715_11840 [Ornithinibacter sp.]
MDMLTGDEIAGARLTEWRKLAQGVVEWVTQQDVDLARRITAIASDHGLGADPASVSVVELGLDMTQD